jgi:hypothetical protein
LIDNKALSSDIALLKVPAWKISQFILSYWHCCQVALNTTVSKKYTKDCRKKPGLKEYKHDIQVRITDGKDTPVIYQGDLKSD